MRKFTLLVFAAILLAGIQAKAATTVVTTPGFTFSPSNFTITVGDTIDFNIGGSHTVVQVDSSNYANNSAVSNGGFNLPNGGVVTGLTAGTYYFICGPHAGSGMKGTFVVQAATSIRSEILSTGLQFNYDPSQKQIRIDADLSESINGRFYVHSIIGNEVMNQDMVLQSGISQRLITVGEIKKGIYIVSFRFEDGIKSEKLLME